MRQNGVPNFPDPTGGSINIGGTGVDPQSASFRSASKRCAKLEPAGMRGPTVSESAFRSALRFAKCLRAHGVNFPDPVQAGSRAAGGTPVIAIAGMEFQVGSTFDVRSPAVQDALPKCGVRLPGRKPHLG